MNINKNKPIGHPQLEIMPIGSVDATILSIVAANLQAILRLNVKIQVPLSAPDYAFLPSRGQYESNKIIRHLSAIESHLLVLGIVDVDICTPILTFIYGESQLGGKTALISVYRITDDDDEKTYHRAAKISLHEVGHLLGIAHCPSPDCLMAFSNNLDKLDALPLRFCQSCEYEARRSVRYLIES